MPQKIQGGDYFLEPTLGLGVTCRKINDPSLGLTPPQADAPTAAAAVVVTYVINFSIGYPGHGSI